jgi:hypothetical protein
MDRFFFSVIGGYLPASNAVANGNRNFPVNYFISRNLLKTILPATFFEAIRQVLDFCTRNC